MKTDLEMAQTASNSKERNKSAKQIEARRRAIRARLSKSGKDRQAAPAHAASIAKFHALEKKIAQARPEERRALLVEREDLGGLQTYQDASKRGAKFGETSKWLVEQLEKRHGRRRTRLLDVGAISGTAYKKYTSFEVVSIDLHPQADQVIQADFFDFPVPQTPFDVVALSLVVNFVGDISKRGQCTRTRA